MPPPTFAKDPAAVLDYRFDWTNWLAAGEEITGATMTATPGLTVEGSSFDGATVTGWLAGGVIGVAYALDCTIHTNQGRTDRRRLVITVKER